MSSKTYTDAAIRLFFLRHPFFVFLAFVRLFHELSIKEIFMYEENEILLENNNSKEGSEWDNNNWLDQDFKLKSLLLFTLPTILLMMFSSLHTAISGVFVSHFVSETAFASLNLVFPWTSAILAIGLMLGTGGCAILSKQMGENKLDEARENLSLLTLFAISIGVLISVIGLYNVDNIVSFLGATSLLEKNAVDYLNLFILFTPSLLLQLMAQMFFIADGKPFLGFIISIIGGLVTILLDYFFIVLINMGIQGAGLATGLGYSVPALIYLIYFARQNKKGLYFTKPKFNLQIIIKTCTNGSSEMVTNLAATITTFLFNIIIIKISGEMGVAAVGVIIYAQYLFQSAFIGYSQGVAPIIGYAFGAKKINRLKNIIKLSVRINIIGGVFMFLITLFLSNTVVGIYITENTDAFDLTKSGLMIFAISFLPQGINIFSSAMFTALSDGKTSAFISFMRTLFLIVVFVLIFPQIIGVNGIWLSIPFAEFVSILISMIFIIKFTKKYNQ